MVKNRIKQILYFVEISKNKRDINQKNTNAKLL